MSERKEYLGDAVYADVDSFGGLVLTTENGLRATNRIVMETETLAALEEYVKRAREQANAALERREGPHASDCPAWVNEPCACEPGRAYRGDTEGRP